MIWRKTKFLFAAATVAVTASSGLAATQGQVSLSHDIDTNHPEAYRDGIITVSGGGHEGVDAYGGAYTFELSNRSGLGDHLPGWGFCIDLTQEVGSGEFDVVALETVLDADKTDALRELWGRNFRSQWLDGGFGRELEAFSAAVWEIVHETERSPEADGYNADYGAVWDVTRGSGFHATRLDGAGLANDWLAGLTRSPEAFAGNLRVLANDDLQDLLVMVPTPAAAWLGMAGLMALGGARQLRRRREA
ncbi:MAG: VPLPA-CTERM sorting domain-containing protein [Phycisphaeraceae bacterium]